MKLKDNLFIQNPETRPKIIIAILMAYGFCISLFLVFAFFGFLIFRLN